jgi:TatA/E family protein of Tat protein translocase
MFGLGFGELVLILIIALIFIGPKKLPELAKGLGQGMKEFQKAAKGLTDQIQEEVKSSDDPSAKKQISANDNSVSDESQKAKEEKHS